jgi:hypothetical protein
MSTGTITGESHVLVPTGGSWRVYYTPHTPHHGLVAITLRPNSVAANSMGSIERYAMLREYGKDTVVPYPWTPFWQAYPFVHTTRLAGGYSSPFAGGETHRVVVEWRRENMYTITMSVQDARVLWCTMSGQHDEAKRLGKPEYARPRDTPVQVA